MLFGLLLFLSLYLPFQIALNPAEGVDLASIRVLIIAIFLAWLASGLKNKKITFGKNPQTLLVASFLFLNIFSIFFARNPEWSARKLLFLFSIFPLYFVASAEIKNTLRMEKIIRCLIFSGTAAAAVGIGQFLAQFVFGLEAVYGFWAAYAVPPFLGRSFTEAVLRNPSWLVNISGATYLRATSFFPDPHMFSYYLGLLAPLALVLFLKNKKWLYLAAFFVLMIADALTFSRGGYLGLFSGFVVFWFSGVSRLNMKYKFLISLAAVVLLIGLFLIPSPISKRFSSSFNLREGSNRGRIETWNQAVEVARDQPFFGTGIGNYPLAIKPTADYREPIYAHNTYLDIAAETGIANAFVWIFLMFSFTVAFLKKSKEDIIFLGCAAGVVIFSVHSLFETAIYSPVVLALLLLTLSFGNIDTNEKNS
ncbi:MAG: hypothetical protein A2288_00270 [Candidatus Moranbacteria bacterium RIFOXYA12_FULL_44_15]|nr:MAG: hypothetical protein A2288_00270 [Candidatus Moranbacteria bacterium RIFOXYA12_FULL_44_15]OGI34608.1 MAG: hypothetical protein A2259_00520 [Candidatus Moranbacteria bacterium RIFOXYA2_FULL_43_15]